MGTKPRRHRPAPVLRLDERTAIFRIRGPHEVMDLVERLSPTERGEALARGLVAMGLLGEEVLTLKWFKRR